MSWNYRIMKHNDDDGPWYGVHEVHYNAKGEIVYWTEDPTIEGDTVVEVIESIRMMLTDVQLDNPVLDYDMDPEGTDDVWDPEGDDCA